LTLIYGLIKPIVAGAAWWGIPFTLLAGISLATGLFLCARFASARIASFLVSFLAVQCILNALLDLKTVFFLSSPFAPSVPTDAVNMANATGIPALVWAVMWIGIAVAILGVTMRLYISSRKKQLQFELDRAFEPIPPVFPSTIQEVQNLR
jgi:hypothetical protein